jgi:ferritin
MLSKKLQDAFNEQMKNEFYSAYLYMAMAGYFQSEDLPGFASWMRVQALEEMTHGEKFFNFTCETGGRTQLLSIDGPQNEFKSATEVFEVGLKHEKFVTASIDNLVEMAVKDKNHGAQIFLHWFVTEQIEEEASFSLVLKKIQRIEGDGRGVMMLDQELGQRVFVPPGMASGGKA